MPSISTHVLDTSLGVPGQGINVKLFAEDKLLAEKKTDEKGRCSLIDECPKGRLRLEFLVDEYFSSKKNDAFFPKVTIEFLIKDEPHYHVPLLLNPFGFSTYRGC